MKSLVIFSVLFFNILAILDRPGEANCAPSAGLEQLAREENVARLKQMVLDSQLDAYRIYQGNETLGHPAEGISGSQKGPLDNSPSGGKPSSLSEVKFVIYQKEPARPSNESRLSDNNNNKSNGTGSTEDDDSADYDKLVKLIHHDAKDHHTNDARQSALLPGLVPPTLGNSFGLGGGNTNPLMNSAFMRPLPNSFGSLPSFQAFHLPGFHQQQQQQQQQLAPPRPPKTSVIGNGGGAMALTNDNVVVVNVLSGNY